jgi:hypothetical protein
MPHLNHKGPEEAGPKTGRRLGECRKKENDKDSVGEVGKGMGKRRHSGGGVGKGKRIKYNTIN